MPDGLNSYLVGQNVVVYRVHAGNEWAEAEADTHTHTKELYELHTINVLAFG